MIELRRPTDILTFKDVYHGQTAVFTHQPKIFSMGVGGWEGRWVGLGVGALLCPYPVMSSPRKYFGNYWYQQLISDIRNYFLISENQNFPWYLREYESVPCLSRYGIYSSGVCMLNFSIQTPEEDWFSETENRPISWYPKIDLLISEICAHYLYQKFVRFSEIKNKTYWYHKLFFFISAISWYMKLQFSDIRKFIADSRNSIFWYHKIIFGIKKSASYLAFHTPSINVMQLSCLSEYVFKSVCFFCGMKSGYISTVSGQKLWGWGWGGRVVMPLPC